MILNYLYNNQIFPNLRIGKQIIFNMKKSVFAFFLSGCVGLSLAQTSKNRSEKDYRNYPHWIEIMQDPQANFFETQNAFYTYWKGRKIEKGGGYKPFKRWEHFMAQQVDEKGNKPQAYQIINELQNVQTQIPSAAMTSSSGWQEVGPVQLPSNGTGQPNGLGRINAIGFHPTDANTFYAGAPAGGLWKTTDGGSTWSSNTDHLATLGVSAIVVDHTNPSVVYFGSGDRDASDAPGLGVYKSTDAGATWTQSNSGMGNRTVGELVMDPNNNSILIAATNGGVYRSTNGGTSWSQSISGNFKDLKLHPTNSSIVYATTGGNLYKSTNNGVSFSLSMTGIPSGKSRLAIGVSPAAPNTVYVLAAQGSVYGGLFKSTDSGATFTTQSTTPNIMDYSTNGSGNSGQAWYDMCIAVHPTNASEVYVGGVNVFKSTNSGTTWTINAHWVGSGGASAVHADQHILRYSPAGKLYVGNDGGVYHKGTSNENWTDISSGLAISQCYKIGQSQTDVNRVIVGYQDNGTGIYDNGNWRTEIGGDGMESAIDYTNSAYMYGELYYGAIRRSTNNGYSFSNIAGNGVNGITESGAWVTPYVLHETDPNTMFIGYRDIWRSTNVKASSSGSVSWTEISTNLGGSGAFSVLEHNEANGNILYASKGSALFKSENVMAASVTWSSVSVPGSGSILSIETSELDENIVYLSRGSRIYKSTNKGGSWTDISSNISNSQNKTSLVYAPMAVGRGLYVATDYGVFFKPENETDWINYSTGLPNYAKIKEIELYEDASGNNNHKIRAASYGRGLWSNDIYLTGEVVNLDVTSANICLGDTATFTADNANTYFWTDPNGTVVGNSATLEVSPTQTTVYTVNGIMSNGDTTQAQATVNIINPVVNIAGQTSVCLGTTATLTANVTGSGSYTYLWSNGATTQSININPTTTTTYTVTATSSEGCSATASQTVNVVNAAEYLVVEIKTDNYPTETSWTLTGNSGNVYQTISQGFYTNANTVYFDTIHCVTDSCLVFNMNDSYGDGICCSFGQGYYKIFQSDGTLLTSGGQFTSSTTSNFCLQVTTPPVFELTVSDTLQTVCEGESVIFTANGADTYNWTDASGTSVSTANSLTLTATDNAIYTVYGYLNGDTLSQTVELIVNSTTVTVTGDTEACEDESIILTASGADSYMWSTGATTSNISIDGTSGLTEVWVIGQSNGCTSDSVVTNLNWLTTPVVTISGDLTVCDGDSTTLIASGADSYIWSDGSTGNTITLSPSANTTITVQGTTNGCASDVVSETVTVFTTPTVTISGNTSVCEGDSVILTATGADTYTWSTGETGSFITITPTSTTTVTVEGETNGCGSDMASETITVNPTPLVSISGNTTLCAGDAVTLTATGADSYLWSTGETTNSITISPDSTTTVSVSGTSAGCNSATVSEVINVNANPVVSISGNTTVCPGDSVTLTATGADMYTWSTGETSNSITFIPDASTTITVQGETNGCSSDVVSTTISINSTPLVSISGNTPLCNGDSVTLTASGADSYTWSTGATGSSITISPNATTVISVQGFTLGCGSDIATETVVVNNAPIVGISSSPVICLGDSITLTASGADSYVWSTGATTASITLTPDSSTTVAVQGFSNGCGSAIVSQNITVNTSTVVSISGDTELCAGESTTLTASGAESYLWSDGSTGSSITITPTVNTTISVQGFSSGCGSDMVIEAVTVNPVPVVSVSGNTAVCSGDSVTLIASGADSYTWSNGLTGNTISFIPDSTMSIFVQGTTNGCTSDAVSTSVTVNQTPVITISGNTEVCEGESITLIASGADSYIWSDGSTGNTFISTPTVNTSISVQGFTNGCASNIASQAINVYSVPVVTISGNTTICEGDSIILTASGADTFIWSTGDSTNSVLLVPTANETITVQGFSNGCSSDIVSESIVVNTNPVVSITGNTAICAGDSITLTANGADAYMWSDGSTSSSITVSPDSSMSVSVQGFSNGCSSAVVSETIVVNQTPMLTLSGNTSVCQGQDVTLTVTGADSYIWSDGSTGNTITLTPLTSGSVSVQGFSNGCASDVITESITVLSTPTITVSGNSTVCEGDSVTLIASGADTYVWSNGDTGNSTSFIPDSSTTISVQGFVTGCGSTMVSESITVLTSPVISVSGNATICSGDSVTLTASGADSYIWSNGATSASVTLTPSTTTTLTVQGVTAGCYSDIIPVTIDVNPIPVVSISGGNTTVCSGDSVILTASGADSYTWSNGATGHTILLSPSATTTISVQGTTFGCTSSTVSTTINVNTSPVITVSGNTEVCEGDSVTLTASGADTYIWSDGSTGHTISFIPSATETISVEGTTNGCGSGTVSTTITVNPLPAVTISGGNTAICTGDTVTLTASGAQDYIWSTGDTTQSIQVITSTDVSISVTGTLNGCVSSAITTIEVIETPVVEITGNLEVCNGESVVLTASGADSYVWSTGETTESITFIATDTTTVSVTGTIGGCASATESVQVVTNSNSSYFVIAIRTDWYGYETTWSLDDSSGNTIAEHTNADGAYQNNTWYRDTIYCATVGSCYSFTINDSYGDGICCSYGSGQYIITQDDGTILAQGGDFDYTETQSFCIGDAQAELDIEVSAYDLAVCKKEEFSLTATGASSYVWTKLNNGAVVSQNATLTTQINQTTTFVVTGTSGNLTGTDTVTVEVMETNKVKIVIKTDWYGYETSWKLKDSSGNVVAQRAANTYLSNRKYKHTIKCLEDECYTLEVYDSYGDGMCCSYGYGYFKIVDANNVVLASGGQFGYQTSAQFCFDGPAAAPLPYEDMEDEITEYVAKTAPPGTDLSSIDNITVYPNPSHGELFIDADDSDFLVDRYEITDLSGRILMDESFNKPFKSKMVDISSLTQGQYIVKLFIGNQIKVVKIIKE